MKQQEVFTITTREAAEQLAVNARCIRKWIDLYGEYIGYNLTEKGHYLLSKTSLERMKEIQAKLQKPNTSMRSLREEMGNYLHKLSHTITINMQSRKSSTPSNRWDK
jgi:transposase-like protein